MEELAPALSAAIAEGGGAPVLFYMRFFLHSIPEEVQDGLMDVIASLARPGDMLAAEFRTDKDEALTKVHTSHYRRYQNGPAYGEALRSRYGFDTRGRGARHRLLAVRRRGPELYRVIARRRAEYPTSEISALRASALATSPCRPLVRPLVEGLWLQASGYRPPVRSPPRLGIDGCSHRAVGAPSTRCRAGGGQLAHGSFERVRRIGRLALDVGVEHRDRAQRRRPPTRSSRGSATGRA